MPIFHPSRACFSSSDYGTPCLQAFACTPRLPLPLPQISPSCYSHLAQTAAIASPLAPIDLPQRWKKKFPLTRSIHFCSIGPQSRKCVPTSLPHHSGSALHFHSHSSTYLHLRRHFELCDSGIWECRLLLLRSPCSSPTQCSGFLFLLSVQIPEAFLFCRITSSFSWVTLLMLTPSDGCWNRPVFCSTGLDPVLHFIAFIHSPVRNLPRVRGNCVLNPKDG